MTCIITTKQLLCVFLLSPRYGPLLSPMVGERSGQSLSDRTKHSWSVFDYDRAVRDRSLRVATIETIEDHKCRLEIGVRRRVAFRADVEPEGRPAGHFPELTRRRHALPSVLSFDVGF